MIFIEKCLNRSEVQIITFYNSCSVYLGEDIPTFFKHHLESFYDILNLSLLYFSATLITYELINEFRT